MGRVPRSTVVLGLDWTRTAHRSRPRAPAGFSDHATAAFCEPRGRLFRFGTPPRGAQRVSIVRPNTLVPPTGSPFPIPSSSASPLRTMASLLRRRGLACVALVSQGERGCRLHTPLQLTGRPPRPDHARLCARHGTTTTHRTQPRIKYPPPRNLPRRLPDHHRRCRALLRISKKPHPEPRILGGKGKGGAACQGGAFAPP